MKNTLGPDQLGGCHSLPFKGEGVGISRKDMIGLVSLSLSLSLSLVWLKWVDLPPCLLIMTDERPINPEKWMMMMMQLVAKKTM